MSIFVGDVIVFCSPLLVYEYVAEEGRSSVNRCAGETGWFVDSMPWTLFVFEYVDVASPIKCRETGWLMDSHDAMDVAIGS